MNYYENTVHFLLDGSSSMLTKWHETIKSINSYVEELKSTTLQDSPVSLYTEREEIYVSVDMFKYLEEFQMVPITKGLRNIRSFKEINPYEVAPGGMTPLNDGVISFVDGIYDLRPKKAVLVILTDGFENCSKNSHAAAKNALSVMREMGYQVVFLGADFENTQQASTYGVNLSNAVVMNTGNYRTTFDTLMQQTNSYMTSDTQIDMNKRK